MNKSLTMISAEMQVIGNELAEATGVPVSTVGVIKEEPVRWGELPECCVILDQFHLDTYPGWSFQVQAWADTPDGRSVSVCIGLFGHRYQVWPFDPKLAFEYPSLKRAKKECDELIWEFTVAMTNRQTPEGFQSWFNACEAANGRESCE